MTESLTPAEFDARELEVYKELWQIEATVPGINDLVHRHAGDQRVSNGYGRPKTWGMSDVEARGRVAYLASSYNYPQDPSSSLTPSDVIARVEQAEYEINERRQVIAEMEEVYWQDPWTRYFPCLNRDGHIHSSLRNCPTVRYDTAMGWATELSGLTPDQAIHVGIPGQVPPLGETLCTVCFPDAPAEWCRTRSEVTKAERERAKAEERAARDAKNAVKNLAETFRAHDGDRVKTVAAAKALVRKPAETEVELEWYRTEKASKEWNDPERYAEFIARMERRLFLERQDAQQLNQILLDREYQLPGSGWTVKEWDKSVQAAARRTRKACFG